MPLLTNTERFDAEVKAGTKLQEKINSLYPDLFSRQAIRILLISIAESHLAEYPQYEDHFEDYEPVRLKRDVTTKGGLRGMKGDVVLARNMSYKTGLSWTGSESSIVFFSNRMFCDVSVMSNVIEAL